MSNLPPGVTHAEIDRHFGGERDDWPGYLECEHEGAAALIDEALSTLDAGEDDTSTAEDLSVRMGRLLAATKNTFEGDEVEDLSTWAAGGYEVTARWTCPVCGTKHETTEEFGPDPDADRD